MSRERCPYTADDGRQCVYPTGHISWGQKHLLPIEAEKEEDSHE